MKTDKSSYASILWDAWCCLSIIGLWPRFIEPSLLFTKELSIEIPNLPQTLEGLKIVQFSDLHLNDSFSNRFAERIVQKINKLQPDLIVFTGDFLCYSHLNHDMERLQNLLCSLKAKYGCYAILGNHDYAQFVSINKEGDYDVIQPDNSRALDRLLKNQKLTTRVHPRAAAVELHSGLIDLLRRTPFELLHNETTQVPIRDSYLNICGLGEYILGRFDPETAFKKYDTQYPGIILSHNPDTAPKLIDFPGEIILSGHTHGGQVNLPWISDRMTLRENRDLKKGLHKVGDKWVYINRGLGSVIKFRWFSPPEILSLTLKRAK